MIYEMEDTPQMDSLKLRIVQGLSGVGFGVIVVLVAANFIR